MTRWEKGWLLLFIDWVVHTSSAKDEAKAVALAFTVTLGVAFMLAGKGER